MKDLFRCDRTTQNWYRYIGAKLNSDGNFNVVYIPRSLNDWDVRPPAMELEFIVTTMAPEIQPTNPRGEPVAVWPLKCCDRDTDGDGNCDIHRAPGIFRHVHRSRPIPPGQYDMVVTDIRPLVRAPRPYSYHRPVSDSLDDITRHGPVPPYVHDLDRRIKKLQAGKVDVQFWAERYGELHRKLDVLYKAVYWILRHLGLVK